MKSSSFVTEKSGLDEEDVLRKNVVNTLERRFFYLRSFKIYNSGVAGFTLYWKRTCWKLIALASHLKLSLRHQVMLKNLLILMVKDEITGTCHRADHLLKDFCNEKLDKYLNLLSVEKVQELKHIVAMLDDSSPEQLGSKIKEYGIVAPVTKNPLSDPYPFNLMFQTSIGPSGAMPGFVLLQVYNGSKLPFAAAQIGQAFRNKISPRQGLLRVREFTLAEIEHFVDPEDKSHPKYSEVVELEFLMFPREEQVTGKDAVKLRLGDAVTNGTVNNQTLGYFIGRVYLFLTCLGISKERLRFRHHLANEMAHYAADCWDAEIECYYGWIECVGIADRSAYDLRAHSDKNRSAYDLRAHSDKSGTPLVAHQKFSAPKEVEKLVITPVKKEMGLAFKEAMVEKKAMEVKAALELKGEVEFQVCTLGKAVTIKSSMVSISKEIKKEHQRVFTPSVIEPSFGIGQIVYCLFEHSFYTRPEDEQLNVFRFPPVVAPIKCTVFSLVQNPEYEAVAKEISKSLTAAGISNRIDITVTIRERDSRDQIRVEIDKVARVVQDVTDGVRTWADIQSEYPLHPIQEDE
ncbi:hypothetical protein MKX01_003456 [Papaver californicum]|nr:hypothetical protein MKX01_003456 [Papaver californicum]